VTSAVLAVLLAAPAGAADQAILGRALTVKNPQADDASRRVVVAVAKETASPNVIVGNPVVGGARLEVITNGAKPTAQVFPLPQGTGSKGQPFWVALGSVGYRYGDREGEQGPVRSVSIKKGRDGRFTIKAKLEAGRWPLDIVPPNLGTDGSLTLTLAGGDRYCVQYGPEGQSTNRAERLWRISKVTAEGCPSIEPTSGDFLALTYNVAGLPEGISGSHPATNTPLISPLLNGYDLVLVQESWQTPDPNPLAPLRVYHELLVADALHPYKSTPAPQPLGADPRRPTAILSDGLNQFAQFPFDPNVVRVAWDGCHNTAADCLAFKGFSVARTTLARGIAVDIYDLHMEAGGDPEDDQLRDAGVTQLAAFIDGYSAGRAVIVGGDFNLHTDGEPDATIFQRLLAQASFTDACAALSCPDPGRIDKFLFRSNGTVTITPLSWRTEDDLFVDPSGAPLSDHDPVAVRFAWSVGG